MHSKFLPSSLPLAIFLHAVLVICVLAKGQLEKPITLIELPEIKRLKDIPEYHQDSHYSKFGLIHGARSCADSGLVKEIRSDICKTEVPAICSMTPDQTSKFEFIFIPTENIDDFKVRVSAATEDGQSKSVEIPMPGQTLKAGESYLYTVALAITEELEDKYFLGQSAIVGKADEQVIICAEANFYGWQKNHPVPEL